LNEIFDRLAVGHYF